MLDAITSFYFRKQPYFGRITTSQYRSPAYVYLYHIFFYLTNIFILHKPSLFTLIASVVSIYCTLCDNESPLLAYMYTIHMFTQESLSRLCSAEQRPANQLGLNLPSHSLSSAAAEAFVLLPFFAGGAFHPGSPCCSLSQGFKQKQEFPYSFFFPFLIISSIISNSCAAKQGW